MIQSDYDFLGRLLHRVALASPFLAKVSFDVEQALASRPPAEGGGKPVFITGLARSGSTILLRSLYEGGVFRSLTYRDMPFVLMPNAWRKISQRQQLQKAASERAHRDRIQVNYDSPEAFEEIFWRAFCAADYIGKSELRPHQVDAVVVEKFVVFIQHVLSSSPDERQRTYLSKNNNNVLRIDAIRRAFPDAVIIVPFRDPLQQAASLLRQHRQFSERHAQDRFSAHYMGWLGHYEFGDNLRRFRLQRETILPGTPQSVDYWLAQWCEVYAWLLEKPAGLLFCAYEKFCEQPGNVLQDIAARSGVEVSEFKAAATISKGAGHEIDDVDNALVDQALGIYARLSASG